MSESATKIVRGWAAQWYPEEGPVIHTVRHTRKEVIEYMADVWRYDTDATTAQSWQRAYRRGCRVVRVEIRVFGHE